MSLFWYPARPLLHVLGTDSLDDWEHNTYIGFVHAKRKKAGRSSVLPNEFERQSGGVVCAEICDRNQPSSSIEHVHEREPAISAQKRGNFSTKAEPARALRELNTETDRQQTGCHHSQSQFNLSQALNRVAWVRQHGCKIHAAGMYRQQSNWTRRQGQAS